MRKLWIVLGIVLVVVVGGFVAVYLAFFNNDSPPPLTLSSTGTTIAGAPTSDPASGDASATTAAPAASGEAVSREQPGGHVDRGRKLDRGLSSPREARAAPRRVTRSAARTT
jgi:hypothetical protein